jgi:hypothetical protein
VSKLPLCGVGSGSGFKASDIANLGAWYDFAYLLSITKDGGNNVSQVNDRSTNAYHAVAAGGEQPVWTASAINGNAALVFNGSTNVLRASGAAAIATGTDTPYSMFTVSKNSSTAASYAIAAFGNSGAANPTSYIYTTGAPAYGFYRRDDVGASAGPAGGTSNTTTPHTISTIFPGTTITVSVDGSVVINGAAADVGATTLNMFSIGGWSTTSLVQPFPGTICEVIIYSRAVTAGEQSRIEAYLKNKWGTP